MAGQALGLRKHMCHWLVCHCPVPRARTAPRRSFLSASDAWRRVSGNPREGASRIRQSATASRPWSGLHRRGQFSLRADTEESAERTSAPLARRCGARELSVSRACRHLLPLSPSSPLSLASPSDTRRGPVRLSRLACLATATTLTTPTLQLSQSFTISSISSFAAPLRDHHHGVSTIRQVSRYMILHHWHERRMLVV